MARSASVRVEVFADLYAYVGEAPHWDERTQTLLFVDLTGGVVFRYDQSGMKLGSFSVGQEVGAVVPRRGGGLVLAVRDGCAPDQCRAFAWLGDTSRIKVNLAERPFDARINTYAASWPAAGGRALASTPPSPAPSAAVKVPNNLYFPSATSIPPVNIMTAEPPPAQRPPQGTTGAADAATPTPPRRPAQTNSQARPPASAAPARATPVPSAPAQ